MKVVSLSRYINWYGLLVIGLSALIVRSRARASDQLPDPPGPVVIGKIGTVAAGDTIAYTYSWGAGARATNYLVTTSATSTNGVWTLVADSNGSGKWIEGALLPSTAPKGGTGVSYTWLKQWLSATPWDSATFTVSVVSRNSVGSSAAISTTWRVLRRPGPPGPITVDSSLIVTGLLVRPPSLNVAIGETKRVCAYPQFWDGALATQTGAVGCDSLRSPLWKFPSVLQQAHTDSMCFIWATSNSLIATINTVPCSLGLRRGLIWQVAQRRGQFIAEPL